MKDIVLLLVMVLFLEQQRVMLIRIQKLYMEAIMVQVHKK